MTPGEDAWVYRALARYNARRNERLYATAARRGRSTRKAEFNHQTHHRGQVTALVKQAGLDPGVTDLVAMLRGVP